MTNGSEPLAYILISLDFVRATAQIGMALKISAKNEHFSLATLISFRGHVLGFRLTARKACTECQPTVTQTESKKTFIVK